MNDFEAWFRRATGGHDPYPYQRALTSGGLPDVLAVPTGAGKTSVILCWLYRALAGNDPDVRRLVLVLPLRTLVTQTLGAVVGWLENLNLTDEVTVTLLMGGESTREAAWRTDPAGLQIVVGTVDMVLSRCLNRGYASSRPMMPMDFGLLSAGTHFVFDEVQLLGPALTTSLQLQGLRDALGTAAPTRTTWMSATVDERSMATVDHQQMGTVLGLTDGDRAGRLGVRLAGRRTVREVAADDRAIAQAVVDGHRQGTLTLVVCNTVRRAVEVHKRLLKSFPTAVLLTSRFRPAERTALVELVLSGIDPEGRVVVSTQVIEAGADLNASLLVTEAAAWPSVVQRAGRLNRDGLVEDAQLLWCAPPRHHPYDEKDVAAAVQRLRELEGRTLTTAELAAETVDTTQVVHPVLRRRDLLSLFDTTPDLSGGDVDVARYIRDGDDLDVHLFWRDLDGQPPIGQAPARRDELCPAPVGGVKEWVKKKPLVYESVIEARGTSSWQRVRDSNAIRPGQVLLVDAASGGYAVTTGLDLGSSALVPVVAVQVDKQIADPLDEAMGDDPLSVRDRWQTLLGHLTDTGAQAAQLVAARWPGLTDGERSAVVRAAELHDIGKAHPVFMDSMQRLGPPSDGVWAKSASTAPLRHDPPGFRHELASALMLAGRDDDLLEGVDADLVRYLVAAHHGKVRLAARPGETDRARGTVLGVGPADATPDVDTPHGSLPAAVLDRAELGLGGGWTEAALGLLARYGPFRLATMEALVRSADWAASGSPQTGVER